MIHIDPEIRKIIPPLQADELTGLEASIQREGCRDPLVIWQGQDIIVDGHNRYDICTKHSIPFETVELAFVDRNEVEQWICQNQLARRNLTDMQRSQLRGHAYNSQKKQQGRPTDSEEKCGHFVHIRTGEALAEQLGVNEKTVRRDATFADALDVLAALGIPVDELTSGQRKTRKNAIIKLANLAESDPEAALAAWGKIVDQGEKSGAIQSAIHEVANEKAEEALPPNEDDLVSIVLGDFRTEIASIANDSVDAILTDPPYPQEYLPLWSALGNAAMRVLKAGGWCIAYSGKQHLAEVLALMTETGLIFYWQMIFLQTVQATDHARAVNTQYKPILLFQKPPLTKPDSYFTDVIKGEGVQKDLHEWQQSENGFAELIERFTMAGQTVVDPFCGSGTVPLVAKALNRRCVAFEIDKGTYASACLRVFGDKKERTP